MYSLLIWDGTRHLVISKADPFKIMTTRPWEYPAIGVILGLIIYAVSGLMRVLDQRRNLLNDALSK
jgi:hypothetical protein